MKAKITSSERYAIEIYGVTYADMKRGTSWNGMTEYVGKDGAKVIIMDRIDWIARLFGSVDPVEGDVVLISPSLVPIAAAE